MSRPIHAIIHYAALKHNLRWVQSLASNSKTWAVVKANAYGHGVAHVFDAFRGADGFALLDLNEAQVLRDLGWRGPILLLEGAFEARDLELCSRLGLWHTIHNEEQVQMLAAHKTQQGHRVFLKLNSGMNRLGFDPIRYRSIWSRLSALHQVEEISLMTHFARTEQVQDVIDTLGVFTQATQDLPGERSLSNSGLLLGHREILGQKGVLDDWVRPGIALYGASPDATTKSAKDWGLRSAQSLRSQIISIQEVKAGDRVGYGAESVAPNDMRIGIVACGYADGYPRVASTQAQVLLPGGIRCNLFGRVSMDMLSVDLTPCALQNFEPRIGSEVTLWGQSSDGFVLPIDEVAQASGTIGYELMCALAARVPLSLDQA
jgi:alanine racemase